MKSELNITEDIARFNEDEYLVLIDDSIDFKSIKGWKTKKRNKICILIPTKKRNCIAYINLYMQRFKVQKDTAIASLDKLFDEYPEICDSQKLLSSLFAKECKKSGNEKNDSEKNLFDDVLKDALEKDEHQDSLDNRYMSNVDDYHFLKSSLYT